MAILSGVLFAVKAGCGAFLVVRFASALERILGAMGL